jgi:hypothetical protein
MATTTSERVKKHRASLRASGMRPIQIWVPDTRAHEFASECRRQSLLAAVAELNDEALAGFMDELLSDIDGWAA